MISDANLVKIDILMVTNWKYIDFFKGGSREIMLLSQCKEKSRNTSEIPDAEVRDLTAILLLFPH